MNATLAKNYTPMIQQFLQIKAEHQDALLFYRMGDFYELFFESEQDMSRLKRKTLQAMPKALMAKCMLHHRCGS